LFLYYEEEKEEDDPAGWVVNGERRRTGRQGELVHRGHSAEMKIKYNH
jgi:hypothetical protein